MMAYLPTLEDMIKREPPTCTCQRCKQCCLIPCWGTPEQMRALVEAGYGDRLSVNIELAAQPIWMLIPAAKSLEGDFAPIFSSESIGLGGCTFWNERGLCDLHDAGLKPVEGRLAHHDHDLSADGDLVRARLAQKWDNEEGKKLVAEWMAVYMPDKLTLHQQHGNLPVLSNSATEDK